MWQHARIVIDVYAPVRRFDCSRRVLLTGEYVLPVPPLQDFNYSAHSPESDAKGIPSLSALTSHERQELAQAMINWWRAWGGVP